jgi:hypothetical protein
MVEQTMEDNDLSLPAAVTSVAATLDMTPEQVMRECVESEQDELEEPEPPDDF